MINKNELQLNNWIKNSRTDELFTITTTELELLDEHGTGYEGVILTHEIKQSIDDELKNRVEGLIAVCKWAGKEIKFVHELQVIYLFFIGQQLKINL